MDSRRGKLLTHVSFAKLLLYVVSKAFFFGKENQDWRIHYHIGLLQLNCWVSNLNLNGDWSGNIFYFTKHILRSYFILFYSDRLVGLRVKK